MTLVADVTEAKEDLAMEGGSRIRDEPLPGWPVYSPEEIDIATSVLRSGKVNYWTGSQCRYFEDEFAEYFGVRHAVALANGTLALELALRILEIGTDDEVIVTPRSYFASASSIAINGAIPVFADVDINSQNITAQSIEGKLTPRTKAILVVHLSGWPCDMTSIMALARSQGLRVIEDCAQAHGARHNGQLVGTFGEVGCFSFCQDKIISTAGEGGMLITDNRLLWESAWSFKDHGKSWERVHSDCHPPGFRWLHSQIGTNWRLTEIQGAIGRLQLKKLDSWLEKRRGNAERLIIGLSDLPALRIPIPSESDRHAYYKFYAFLRPELLKDSWDRDRILRALEAEGVPGMSGSCPEIYREAAFRHLHHPTLTIAHELGRNSIMLPVHPTLRDADIDDLIAAVRKVINAAAL